MGFWFLVWSFSLLRILTRNQKPGTRNWRGGDRGEETIAAAMHGLDKPRRLSVIPQRLTQLNDAECQCAISHCSAWPQRRKQLRFAHQLPGMLYQIAQHGKGFAWQENLLTSTP